MAGSYLDRGDAGAETVVIKESLGGSEKKDQS